MSELEELTHASGARRRWKALADAGFATGRERASHPEQPHVEGLESGPGDLERIAAQVTVKKA